MGKEGERKRGADRLKYESMKHTRAPIQQTMSVCTSGCFVQNSRPQCVTVEMGLTISSQLIPHQQHKRNTSDARNTLCKPTLCHIIT